jgi:hypothetical protein
MSITDLRLRASKGHYLSCVCACMCVCVHVCVCACVCVHVCVCAGIKEYVCPPACVCAVLACVSAGCGICLPLHVSGCDC